MSVSIPPEIKTRLDAIFEEAYMLGHKAGYEEGFKAGNGRALELIVESVRSRLSEAIDDHESTRSDKIVEPFGRRAS
ncbi:hypothetical protein ACOSOMT5_P2927 [Acidiphilium sp. MT5]